jgi:hypothetical protein
MTPCTDSTAGEIAFDVMSRTAGQESVGRGTQRFDCWPHVALMAPDQFDIGGQRMLFLCPELASTNTFIMRTQLPLLDPPTGRVQIVDDRTPTNN